MVQNSEKMIKEDGKLLFPEPEQCRKFQKSSFSSIFFSILLKNKKCNERFDATFSLRMQSVFNDSSFNIRICLYCLYVVYANAHIHIITEQAQIQSVLKLME